MVIAAPNATIIRHTSEGVDPFLFICLRFGFVALIAAPFAYKYRKEITKKTFTYAMIVSIAIFSAVFSFVYALQQAPASYVSIITLITPITFVLYSIKLTGDKVSRRSALGVVLAALGAFVVVFSPIALSQHAEFKFYPLATLLILINTLTYPLATIYSKKANEAGMKIISIIGFSSVVTFSLSLIMMVLFGDMNSEQITNKALWGVVYSGLAVALIARALGTKAYEHIGAAAISSLFYIEILMSIAIPIFVLNEKLSLGMILGGALILLGVYFVEFKSMSKIKRLHLHRHH